MKELARDGSEVTTLTLKQTLCPQCGFDIFPFKDITLLYFSKNRLGPHAFNFLMLALAKAPETLTYIDASSNMATHEFCTMIAEMISLTKSIKWLDISDNPLTTSAAERERARPARVVGDVQALQGVASEPVEED